MCFVWSHVVSFMISISASVELNNATMLSENFSLFLACVNPY